MTFRYSLDKTTPTRLYKCPSCGKQTLKRYWDNENGNYMPDDVGRCNREVNCAYHLTPKAFLEKIGSNYAPIAIGRHSKEVILLPTYIPKSYLDRTMNRDEPNNLIRYLRRLFKEDLTQYLVNRFKLGTSTYWKGSTMFWQIDERMNIHAGKIMLYDSDTGRRCKHPFNHIQWAHSVAKWKDFRLDQCFFGLHQINTHEAKSICIVESEKTAVLMTALIPNVIWLASGGMNLSIENFRPLKQFKLILFPDVGVEDRNGKTPYQKWQDKASLLESLGYTISVSSVLENKATIQQREKGYDLADYLMKTDTELGLALNDNAYPVSWDFNSNTFPTQQYDKH